MNITKENIGCFFQLKNNEIIKMIGFSDNARHTHKVLCTSLINKHMLYYTPEGRRGIGVSLSSDIKYILTKEDYPEYYL